MSQQSIGLDGRVPRTPPNSPNLQAAFSRQSASLLNFSTLEPSAILLDPDTGIAFAPEIMFGLFKYLPKEIRCVIWIMAAENEPRILIFTERPLHLGTSTQLIHPAGLTSTQQHFGAFFRGRIDRRPQVARTSKEALTVLLRTGVYKPGFALRGSSKAPYFNPDVDTIRLCNNNMGFRALRPILTLGMALANPMELVTLTRLEFPYATFVKQLQWAGNNIKEVFNLRTLILSCTSYDWERTAAEPYVMEMSFEPHLKPCVGEDGDLTIDYEMIPWCKGRNGRFLQGMAAMRTALARVRHRACKIDLFDKWSDLSRIANTELEMPDTVLKITYIPNNLS